MIRYLLGLGLVLHACSAFGGERIYGIVGDAGVWNENARAVRESLRAADVRHLILPGDNLYKMTDDYGSVWDHWTKHGFLYDVVAIGNHSAGYAQEVEYFRMPGEYYSRVAGGEVRFIVLNSDNQGTAGAQASWLETELSNAQETFVFVVLHHPPFTISDRHQWQERAAFHEAIRPVFWKHRSRIASLVLGHDHISALVRFNDLPAIVSGAVQEVLPPKRVDDMQDGVRVRTEWAYDGTPSWVRLSIDAAHRRATARFIKASSGKSHCEVAFDPQGDFRLGESCR